MRNPLNRIQTKVMHSLEGEEQTVKELAANVKVSEVYIRQQIQIMMEMGLIERVDQRQPYIFRKKQIDIKQLNRREAIKKALLSKKPEDVEPGTPLKPFIDQLFKLPKAKWVEAFEGLELMEDVILELQSEGKLIDTL